MVYNREGQGVALSKFCKNALQGETKAYENQKFSLNDNKKFLHLHVKN